MSHEILLIIITRKRNEKHKKQKQTFFYFEHDIVVDLSDEIKPPCNKENSG